MLKREQALRRNIVEILCVEDKIPQDHLLRKIDKAVDFSKIYDIVGELYCADNGRVSVDPVVLFKCVLIQHLYGIPSLRRTMAEIEMNLAYRWFLGYAIGDELPHFSTVSYNFRNRFNEETIEEVFRWILLEANAAGYLSPEVVYIDGTHIKANANVNKRIKKVVQAAAARYREELLSEVNRDRDAHGKPPLDGDPPAPKEKQVSVSKTDPESGLFHKGDHQLQFAYGAHTACDANNFVLAVEVTPGNVNDSVAFHPLYDKLCTNYPQMAVVVADCAYKTPYICKRVFNDGRVLSTAYKRPTTMKGGHEWYKYVYDARNDCVICPEGHTLHYATTNRDGFREYKSKSSTCKNCPTRDKCTHSVSCEKTVQIHVWHAYMQLAEDIRLTPRYKAYYEKRKEKIERVFADAKEKYAMRYTQYRGLASVSIWVKLKFAAMNLKKLAVWKWRDGFPPRPSPCRLRSFAFTLLFG